MKKRKKGSPAMILITVCIAQFMAPFMLTSVGVALPSLGRDLSASAVQLGLVEQLYTPNTTAIMGSVERRQFGVASGMIGAMRTLGMAVSLTTISLIFSLCMGGREITPETLSVFLLSMKTGLVAYAIFSCLGVILSFGRGKKS